MIPKPIIRLNPIVDNEKGLTFAGLLAIAERLRFESGMEDTIDIQAVPVHEQRLLENKS